MTKLRFFVTVLVLVLKVEYSIELVLEYSKVNKQVVEDFDQYESVIPKIYHPRQKRELLSTKDEYGNHLSYTEINLTFSGKEAILDLKLNKDLIPKGFFQLRQENGNDTFSKPTLQEIDFCHYSGSVRGYQQSWIALSTCDGINGIIHDGTHQYYITSAKNSSDVHFIHRISSSTKYTVPINTVEEIGNKYSNYHFRRKKSSNQHRLRRSSYNTYEDPRYIELVIVLDNGVYTRFSQNTLKTTVYANSVANIINSIYSQVNIFIVLIGVVIWTEADEFVLVPGQVLPYFTQYCKQKLATTSLYDSAHLISSCNVKQGYVGLAWVGTMCRTDSIAVIDDQKNTVSTALTMAHELGHNLGLNHYNENPACSSTCQDNQCIMTSSRNTLKINKFSACSTEYLQSVNTITKHYCLNNKPVPLFNNSPICGNRIVEFGEECDCGMEESCTNPCCNATTCRFKANATCATGSCCNLESCKIKPAATTCRYASNECDLPEYCNGESEYCPPDTYKLETETCDEGQSYCHHGSCLREDRQCRRNKGFGYNYNEECYLMHLRKRNDSKICTTNQYSLSTFYDKANKNEQFRTCNDQHFQRLDFDSKSLVLFSRIFQNQNHKIACTLVMIDAEPEAQPDVSLCNQNKAICTKFSKIRNTIPICPQDCNGNGWCNNKGQCHCKDGFAPPDCYHPGYGGSLTSGFSSDPSGHIFAMKVIFIIFLGVVPLAALLFLIPYCILPIYWPKRFGEKHI